MCSYCWPTYNPGDYTGHPLPNSGTVQRAVPRNEALARLMAEIKEQKEKDEENERNSE